MKILIACESSGTVRDAFIKLGEAADAAVMAHREALLAVATGYVPVPDET